MACRINTLVLGSEYLRTTTVCVSAGLVAFGGGYIHSAEVYKAHLTGYLTSAE